MSISIITPVRNGAATIEKCLEAVFQQRDCVLEHIIVDGESTDGTLDIVKKYRALYGDANKTNCLRVVSAPPLGIADAFNRGIKTAKGDWIGIINADDWYEPDALAQLLPFMTEVKILHGKLRLHKADGASRISGQKPNVVIDPFKKMPAHHPTCFVPRSIYEKVGLFHDCYHIAMDYDFLLRAHQKGVAFQYVDQIIANFASGGISTLDPEAGQREMLASQILNMKQVNAPLWRYVREKMKAVERKFMRRFKKGK